MKTPTDISKRRHLYFQELPICQILRLGGSPRIQMLHQCFGNEYNDYTSDFSNLHNLLPEASILGLRLAIIGIARSRDNWRARATFHIGWHGATLACHLYLARSLACSLTRALHIAQGAFIIIVFPFRSQLGTPIGISKLASIRWCLNKWFSLFSSSTKGILATAVMASGCRWARLGNWADPF